MAREKTVELYEMPACGDPRLKTEFNPVLREVNEMVKELEAEGVRVFRYLPSEDLSPFFRNPKVAALMYNQRLSVLPITVVNGDIIKVEAYPSLEDIRSALSRDGE
jgi:hypothetical protein